MGRRTENYLEQFVQSDKRLGATYVEGQGAYFRLWAPYAKTVRLEWEKGAQYDLQPESDGYFAGHFPEARPGDRYWFRLDGNKRIADPASRFQPEDTRGPSEIVVQDFEWTDKEWRGIPFTQWVIYEVHIGTYSTAGDFDGLRADLPRLKALGVTTIEIMPVSQFSGARNWGYDGVFPHAVQHSYGGPEALKRLVDACHAHGLAIILDVVFNHLGPEGNVLFECGPYKSETYTVPWGDALNFDDAHSHNVRRYFLQAAWQWLSEYHFDGLRLDAVQMIFDNSPVPFLEDLYGLKEEAARQRNCPLILIAETDKNDCRVIMPPQENGLGMDAQWADDFHHALHVLLTGESKGYYADYGGLEQLARIYQRGVAFEGEYSAFRQRFHGRSYEKIDKRRLVIELQNHDQTGNRLEGDRIVSLVGLTKAKLGAACVLLSPFLPFLFMGEELAATQPFLYFISHHDSKLNENAKNARREEWKSFDWADKIPDPADPETFYRSVLDAGATPRPEAATEMQEYYRQLISLSKKVRQLGAPQVTLDTEKKHIILNYADQILALLSFAEVETPYDVGSDYVCILQSAVVSRQGHVAPYSANVWRAR